LNASANTVKVISEAERMRLFVHSMDTSCYQWLKPQGIRLPTNHTML